MNIVYCIPHLYNSGGMERVLTQKANWLAAHTAHDITIITTERTPEGIPICYFPLDKRVRVEALQIDFNADYHKPLFAKWVGHMRRMRVYERALTEYICAKKIDLCISLCGKEVAFLRHLPCRTIVEMHFAKDQRRQLMMTHHGSRFWLMLGAIRTWQLVRAVKPIERLVVLTKKDQADWQEAGCTNVEVIPNVCSLDGRKVSMKPKGKVVLAVGRLHEQKGFDLLLQAWQAVEARHADWTLRIVGEGEQRKALEEQIARLGLQRVCLAGQIKEMADEYAKASLFVLSSRYEGLPLALIEAMWCGLPCIAFDCPQGPAELLADRRGWLVPDGDTEALSAHIEYAIAHPDEAVQRAWEAQSYAQTTYSEAAVMPLWIRQIEQ